jgi:two-component system sensor histidine kinase KdpD
MEELTGYSRQELLNMNLAALYAEPLKRLQSVKKIVRSGKTATAELTLKKKDGSQIIAAVTDTPVIDKAGKVIYLDGILEDISENIKTEARLVEIKTLKQLNISRADLLSNVSHELRTPLASIKGFIETLMEPDVKWSKKQQLDFLQSAVVEVDRLTFLIHDLLMMSKLDSGTMVLEKKSYGLCDILESVQAVLLRIAVNHKLEIKVSQDLPPIIADKIRIAQVLTNLVENACKFSPEGRLIVVEAKPAKSNVVISVKDSGVGMTLEVITNLFNRFYQAQQAVSGKTKGTGLGLAICKGIVEAHSGKIWVESQPGKGSKFSFSIPANKQ